MRPFKIAMVAVAAAAVVAALSACTKEPAGQVSFTQPTNGASVVSPFTVRMTANGVTVEPASAGVHDGRGHHHIIVGETLPPKGQPIPSDAQHLHFGKAQTEATLDLPPGEHTLQLLFAKGDHISYDPIITSSIKLTVTAQRKVSFLEPVSAAQVTSPFTVKMGAAGITVEPASAGVHEGAGHHHIIVDADLPASGQPIPSDAQHLHFGKAQTEAALDLPPGEHTLHLVFADANHVPYSPYVTSTLKVTVVK
ncbi:MAG: DUF4399 domain-containing protein [Chloroflexi bacterium]|nr:DUF4399 domain-containing protein [Chloroflexota bacterium]